MKKKILIGSIFAAMLMLLVPLTAVAAVPSNDTPKEAEEKTAPILTDKIPALDDPSTLTNEELVKSIENMADLFRGLGDESTADAIEQELSLVLESDEVIINSMGLFDCLKLRLAIMLYKAAASFAYAMFIATKDPCFLQNSIAKFTVASALIRQYNELCGGDIEDVTLANNDLTAISGETYTTSECSLCGSS
jgi:hypothetical protein